MTQDDLNTLQDIIFNALDIENLTNEQTMGYWNILPEHLKLDVFKYGITDTPTRENIYVWIKKTQFNTSSNYLTTNDRRRNSKETRIRY